ncbi:MAG: histidinol dehydrogenase, partial [Schwartzia sp.]|nr:histidinol dehydrogenase [Schwartzia sp. (in: firmicutes)]
MRIVNVKDCGEQEVERLLRKAAFDEVELSPAIREGNKKLFGADLTAAEVVAKIVGDVRREGDAAVMRYTKLIDRTELTPDNFVVSQTEFKEAETLVDGKVMESLRRSIANVRRYHEEQKPKSWMTYREEGSLLGQSVLPLDRVGLYVPGGT